ncbi:2-hydroxyacid dehydrogenase [Paenibacillus rhizoplanae]
MQGFFDMNVLASARKTVVQADDLVTMTDIDTLLSTSDIVSVHVPLTEQTKHLINQEVFKKMKNTALFLSIQPAGDCQRKRLDRCLKKTGELSGACLDVYESEPLPIDSELRTLSNVILTPHTAGMPDGRKFHKKRYDFFIDNIKRVQNGKAPVSRLNQLL